MNDNVIKALYEYSRFLDKELVARQKESMNGVKEKDANKVTVYTAAASEVLALKNAFIKLNLYIEEK